VWVVRVNNPTELLFLFDYLFVFVCCMGIHCRIPGAGGGGVMTRWVNPSFYLSLSTNFCKKLLTG